MSTWEVSHSAALYDSGLYWVEVRVYETFVIDWPLCYGRGNFTLKSELFFFNLNVQIVVF